MAANDYTVLATAKAVVTSRFGTIDDGELEALLEASACTNADAETVYQPYLVAGWLMRSRWQQYKSVRSAAGSAVEYASPDEAYKALANLQAALSVGLTCPVAWTAAGSSFSVVW